MSINDSNNSNETFGLTGTATGSSGDHLATTGASALGTSGGSGDPGSEKTNVDQATKTLPPPGSTVPSSSKDNNEQGTR